MAPKFWYIFKSIYLLLSARQIKSGYPTRILGNCFTKNYGIVNSTLFYSYMLVPFLYDMRLMMDWMWTDTSLGLNEWAIMEDINKQLFIRKCELTFEENFPEPRGSSRRRKPKYLKGASFLLLMIGAIWFPLFVFALGGTIGQSSKPADFSVEIEFSGYQPIFKMSSTSDNLKVFSPETFSALEVEAAKNGWASGQNFLASFDHQDAVVASINGNSTAVWGISPPSQMALIEELKNDNTIIPIKITWSIARPPAVGKNPNFGATIRGSHTVLIEQARNKTLREELIDMLLDPKNETVISKKPIILEEIWPNYIEIPETGYPKVVEGLGPSFRNIALVLRKDLSKDDTTFSQWWELSEFNCSANSPFNYFDDHKAHCKYMTSVLFSNKVFPGPFLQLISGYG